MKRRIALLAGARPNYMKVFPVWRELHDRHPDLQPVLIHTGQHYDEAMSDVFFRDFGMPAPDYFLGVGSGPHGAQTGQVMIALEAILLKDRPDLLVVVGDVNSTVAGTLVAVKMGIPVAHIEAGLRSRDRSMPEEINRLATDAISDLLLTSCRDADLNLLAEGIPAARIRFVGNVMIDSLVELLPRAQASRVLSDRLLMPRSYAAVTLHRPSNVDEPGRLLMLMDQLSALARDMPVVFPLHPRTRKMLEASGFRLPDARDSVPQHGTPGRVSGLLATEPLGYLDFLRLQSDAAVVITDSGGVQEETSFLGIPCLTVRPNTERPITITQGTNRLVDPAQESLATAAREAMHRRPGQPPVMEGWDGRAATRIVAALRAALAEPTART